MNVGNCMTAVSNQNHFVWNRQVCVVQSDIIFLIFPCVADSERGCFCIYIPKV